MALKLHTLEHRLIGETIWHSFRQATPCGKEKRGGVDPGAENEMVAAELCQRNDVFMPQLLPLPGLRQTGVWANPKSNNFLKDLDCRVV